ncbi:MAG: sugar transporter [Betaproteobacteria bacterium]|nr:MAG: sugar transporter [Betaproteobacteria bacterium]
MQFSRTIFRTLCVIGLAIAAPAALAQFYPPRPGDPMTAPGTAPQFPSTQTSPVQTPTINNSLQYPQYPQQKPGQIAPRPGQEPAPTSAPFLAPRPSLERNEFQEFIFASTGQRLPIFGQELFEGSPSTFAPVENIPVPADYVVGPGDELMIRAWGQIDVDYRAVVDRNGTINIPRIGSLNVAGIKYADLTNYVRNAVSRNYRNFDLMVTLGQLRAVQVFVVGYARRPGSYTVSSLSTLVNAIFAAGGPSLAGSMRGVQLKRGPRTVTELDLYDLLLAGDKTKDASLLPGDVIYFPPIGPLAAVSGSVNHPAIFELKGQATLDNVLGYAGGLSTTAQSRQITIERIDDRKARVVEQFDYAPSAAQRPVKDGDVISVLSILPKFENTVTLRGNVATPLRYPFRPGMRIRDLIPDKETLITPEYYRRQNLAARKEPTAQAQPISNVSGQLPGAVRQGELSAQEKARQERAVTQEELIGSVRRLSDEINWDYAVIERLNKNDLTTSLIPFNLGKAILENDPANNLPLMPGDVVTVFSKTDVAAPSGRRPIIVSLEGEFTFAGVYQARPGETARQLVVRVGGVTSQAYVFGAEFTRESTRRDQEQRLKQATDQVEQEVQRAAVTRAQSVISPEDAAALKQEAEAQRALVARMRTLKPTGRVVLEMPEDATVANLPDIALEDGDRLHIPKQPSMVNVFGTVFNESAFVYSPDKNVGDYLSLAGGPRKQADERSIYVLRANGSVASSRQRGILVGSVSGLRLMPGDTIVVPEDFERTTWMKDLKDWTQIFYQFGLGAAALKVIKE